MRDKFLSIEKELNTEYFERKDVIRGLLVGLLSRQHVLLLGPPGTGKSDLVENLCSRFQGAYFRWLITRYTVPEEIFGPVSLKALEQDKHMRITTNKLPEANIAFLDEVWKGSSSILNALLTIMNERLFFNDGAPVRVPLEMVVGASNELPEDREELGALWDRFLLRYVVDYIKSPMTFQVYLSGRKPTTMTTITKEELAQAQAEVEQVDAHKTYPQIGNLRQKMNDLNIPVSDRRWKQLLGIIKAHAWLEGRAVATDDDLAILAPALWQEPNQIAQVRQAIMALANPLDMEAQDLLDQATEIFQAAMQAGEDKATAVGTECNAKLKSIAKKLEKLSATAKEKGKSDARIREVMNAVANYNKEVIKKCLGIEL